MSYKGNPNLIRENTVREFTPEQMAEMYRCATDIEYFSEKYVTIVTLDKGKTLMQLYDYQKDMLKLMSGETIKDEKYNVITLARAKTWCH